MNISDNINMDVSKSAAVKFVKAIGKYKDLALREAVDTLDDTDVTKLLEVTKKLKAKLDNVKIEQVEGKKEPKQQAMLSQQEKLRRTVRKIDRVSTRQI